jgi:hypothetical protein
MARNQKNPEARLPMFAWLMFALSFAAIIAITLAYAL